MQVILAKNWWSLVIRGLAAILVGVITVIRNAISIDELVLLFFVYALFDGVVGIGQRGAIHLGPFIPMLKGLFRMGRRNGGEPVRIVRIADPDGHRAKAESD